MSKDTPFELITGYNYGKFSGQVDSIDLAARTAQISGIAEPDATVIINDYMETQADAEGKWSYHLTGLKLGSNPISIEQWKNAEQIGDAYEFDVMLEVKPIQAAVAFPEDRTADAVLSGSAHPGATVEVRDMNGDVIAEATANTTTGKWSTAVPAPNKGGDYDVRVYQVIDGERNGDSLVTIAYGAAVSVTDPIDDAAHDGGTLTMKGHGEPGAQVAVREEGKQTVLGYTTVLNNGNWSLTTSTIDDKKHVLVVSQEGKGNNVTTATITINPDASAVPAPTGSVAFDTDVTKNAVASGTGADGAEIEILDGTTRVGTAKVVDGEWSTPITPVAAGTRTLTVQQTLDGETSETTITADYGQAVEVTDPAPGRVTPGNTTVSGTGADGAEITVRAGAKTATTTVQNGTWSVELELPASNTPVTLDVSQHAKGNLTTTAEVTVTPNADQTATPVAITGPADGLYTPLQSTTVSGTATPYATVVVKNQWNVALATVKADANGAWSFQRVYGPSASYTLTATQTRFDGTTSTSASFALSPVGAFRPLAVTSHTAGGTYTPGTNTFSGTATPGATVTAVNQGARSCSRPAPTRPPVRGP